MESPLDSDVVHWDHEHPIAWSSGFSRFGDAQPPKGGTPYQPRFMESLNTLLLGPQPNRAEVMRSTSTDGREQSFDVSNAVGPTCPGTADHTRNMVRDHSAAKVHLIQCLHQLEHVRVAVIHEGFHKARNRSAHVAKVDLPELVHFRKSTGSLKDVLPHLLAAFHPGSRAETHADVRTVGDFQGARVAVEVPEDAAGHSAQFRHRWIVRMDANAHSQLFGNRSHLSDEIRVVFPKLFLAELAAVSERAFKDFPAPIPFRIFIHVEGARRRPAASGLPCAAPYAVAHVRVGGVENAGLGQVPQKGLVLLDLLIAAWQVQCHFRHVVDVAVANVPDF